MEEAQWYVVHTYSGYENKVKDNLLTLVENRRLQDVIPEVRVPTEIVPEVKDGKARDVEHKLFPGYVFVKMCMTDETWYIIKGIKGVFNFVGMGEKPLPLTEEELKSLGIGGVVNVDYEVGDSITIITEPFYNYAGIIEKLDKERQRVTVRVDMFGRETTVELDFTQVQKI